MAEPAVQHRVTPEEYLAFERAAPERHELIDGEVVAMSGGTRRHALIAGKLIRVLGNALLGRPCDVFGSDLRVRIPASDLYTYPDVSVVCGESRLEDEQDDTLENPLVIFEVLSDSTESYDRGEKFARYRTLPSLAEYVLVSQKRPLVEHFQRQGDGSWLLRTFEAGESMPLPALGCELAVDEIYLKVFDEPG
ncbi:MAG TPA: Uma2 family endonuclease [Thermoanaerobaculia bacterium]|nr:Uma2 family endonuclease [Thermoanaerobaculia bacterium]